MQDHLIVQWVQKYINGAFVVMESIKKIFSAVEKQPGGDAFGHV